MRIVLLTIASATLLLAAPFQAVAEEEVETLTAEALARLTRIDLDPAFERAAETQRSGGDEFHYGEPTQMNCQDAPEMDTCFVTSHRDRRAVPAAPAPR